MLRAKSDNPHGWGAVFYAQIDAYIFREPRPDSDSYFARVLHQCGIYRQIAISHIRKATSGEVALKNTHPFTRELDGNLHNLAFNGDIPKVFDLNLQSDRFLPIGNSNAEHAYCWLLNELANSYIKNDVDKKAAVLHFFGCQLAEMGPSNFLYSDSKYLFVFSSRRRHPDGEYLPGLHMLIRQCNQQPISIPCVGLSIKSGSSELQEIALLASVPSSDDGLVSLRNNELIVLKNGRKILAQK